MPAFWRQEPVAPALLGSTDIIEVRKIPLQFVDRYTPKERGVVGDLWGGVSGAVGTAWGGFWAPIFGGLSGGATDVIKAVGPYVLILGGGFLVIYLLSSVWKAKIASKELRRMAGR